MSRLHIDFTPEKEHLLPQLLYVSYSKYEKDKGNIMHSHSFTEFLYLDAGEGAVLTRSHAFPVKGGDFVVFPSGLYHTEKSGIETNMEYYVLAVSNIIMKGYTPGSDFNPVLSHSPQTKKFGEDIKKIFSFIKEGREGYEVELLATFYDIMRRLIELPSSPFSLPEANTQKGQMVGVKDYIDTHYMKNFNLDDLSELFHLSKYHLVREFSRVYGRSPMSYLEDRRIREAKYLLSSTHLSMTEIASTLGFSSSSYFSQRFHASVSMTPMDYRRSLEKGEMVDGI